MKFTVLMSIYKNDCPNHFSLALDSVYKFQTLKPSEIILIKDGELTSELNLKINNFINEIPVLRTFGYKENKGTAFALDYGLSLSSNEIICRMDSDDISTPERFENQISFLRKNPEIVIIGSNIEEFWNEPGDIKSQRKVPLRSSAIDLLKYFKNPFNHMSVAFRKSAVQQAGGYLNVPGYEDYYLWMRMLKLKKGLNIDKTLVYARIGNGMINRRHGIEFLKKEFSFQFILWKKNLTSFPIFLLNVLLRCVPRVFPLFFFRLIYSKLLRK